MAPDPHPPEIPSDPVTEAVAVDAIAAHATESHGGHGPLHTHCENCGAELRGPFCHRCGQHDFDIHRSFGHLFLDALENFFHFDEKLFRNIVTLLFRPGELSAAFNAGKRVAQMPPLRFYIFVSVLFFFINFLGSHRNQVIDTGRPGSPAERQVVRQALDQALREVPARAGDPAARARAHEVISRLRDEVYSPTARPIRPGEVDRVIAEEIRKAGAAPQAGPVPAAPARTLRTNNPSGLNLSVQEKNGTPLERFLTEKGLSALEHENELIESFIHALPKMLLFCLPFFALLTRLFFRGARQAYLQHLVVALHFHTFIFLWSLVRDGWADLAFLAGHRLGFIVRLGCNLWLLVYPFLMFRRLFGNSWFWTIVKTGVIAMAYGMMLAVGFMVTGLVLVLLL